MSDFYNEQQAILRQVTNKGLTLQLVTKNLAAKW